MLYVFRQIFYGVFLSWFRGSVLSAAHSSKTENCLNMFIGVTCRDYWTRIRGNCFHLLKCCCWYSHLNLGFSPWERANPTAFIVRQIALFFQTLWSTWSFCSFLSFFPFCCKSDPIENTLQMQTHLSWFFSNNQLLIMFCLNLGFGFSYLSFCHTVNSLLLKRH